jgi:hypothetical protein
VLVGRETALGALRAAAEATKAGRSITVLVGGGPGMGKSTTVHHFLDELAVAGEAVILRGRAYERETVPFKAIDGVVDALSRHLMSLADAGEPLLLPEDVRALGRLFPVLQRVPGVPGTLGQVHEDSARVLRQRAFDALRELLETIAAAQPLVLFVDDAHWGDLDSAAILLEVLRPLTAPPLLLLLAYRDEEADRSPMLAEMRERWPEGAERRAIAIDPLDVADAQALALALLDASDEVAQRIARAVAREARGSPFLVEELVRANRGRTGADEATLVLMTLDEVVGQRLARLPEKALGLLEIVAVAGRPLPASLLATASNLGDISDALVVLADRRLARTGVRDGREVVEVTHDHVREILIGRLPADVVRGHHARLATAMEATPDPDPEALAAHLIGAGDAGRAAAYTERAAEQAASKLAFDQAARLFRLELEMVDHPAGEARRLRVRLAQMLEGAGRASEAAAQYQQAALGASSIERVELERSAAEQIVASGRVDEGTVALRRVLEAMGMSVPRSALGAVFMLLLFGTLQRLVGSRFRERGLEEVSREDRVRVETLRAVSERLGTVNVILGAAMQARHLLLAMRVGDRLQVLRAMCIDLIQFAVADHSEGRRERRMLEAARGLASRAGDDGRLQVDGARGLALYLRGHFPEALETLDAVLADPALAHQQNSGGGNVRLFAVFACFFTGRLREEARRAAPLLRDVEQRGDFYTAVCLRSTVMVDISLARDDPDGAQRHLREAMARWTRNGFSVQHWYAMLSEANIALYVGDGAGARALLDRDAKALRRSFLLRSRFIVGFTAFVRACAAVASIDAEPASRPARVREARRLARQLERAPAAWSKTLASLARAAAANAAGDRDQAIEALREALARSEGVGMQLHAWGARYRLGSLLGGDEGAALVAQAEQAMTAEGVRNPDRMAGIYLPGRWSLSRGV